MISRMSALLTLLACCAMSLGCEKKEVPPASEPPAVAPTPAAAAPVVPAATEPTIDVATLPVEEQYEAEAEQEITAANVQQKLDEIEKEISAP